MASVDDAGQRNGMLRLGIRTRDLGTATAVAPRHHLRWDATLEGLQVATCIVPPLPCEPLDDVGSPSGSTVLRVAPVRSCTQTPALLSIGYLAATCRLRF